jgi:putative membrane protein
MIIKKNLSFKSIYEFTGHHLYWLTAWMVIVASLYYFTNWRFITIPWLPLSLIGTAVAFYVGFKNSQSYSRLWEARKIWGAIVNNSRKLGSLAKNLRSDDPDADFGEQTRKQIIFRHIEWLYQLREQLLEPAPWEHVSSKGLSGYYNRRRRKRYFSRYETELEEAGKRAYIPEEEKNGLQHHSNKAVQLLDLQTKSVQALYQNRAINFAQQIKIQEIIDNLYDEQGRAERIKRFPFPRKYASFSFVFVCIFIFLLPFGIVGEFSKLGSEFVWMSIPVGVIVGWVYVVMEIIGDYSENPFQGLHNDIPMLSISRAIEIDLLQMFGEKDVPKPIQPKGELLL